MHTLDQITNATWGLNLIAVRLSWGQQLSLGNMRCHAYSAHSVRECCAHLAQRIQEEQMEHLFLALLVHDRKSLHAIGQSTIKQHIRSEPRL